jgi:hypothetical protein
VIANNAIMSHAKRRRLPAGARPSGKTVGRITTAAPTETPQSHESTQATPAISGNDAPAAAAARYSPVARWMIAARATARRIQPTLFVGRRAARIAPTLANTRNANAIGMSARISR